MNDVLLLAVLQSLDAGDVDTARGLADLAGDDAAIETLLSDDDVAESVQGPKGPPPFPGAVFDTGRHRWVKPVETAGKQDGNGTDDKLSSLPEAKGKDRWFNGNYGPEVAMQSLGFSGKGKGFGAQAARAESVEMVLDPAKVKFTQTSVTKDLLARKIADPTAAGGLDKSPVLVVKDGDEYHLQGGNHRAAAEVVRTGKFTARVVETAGKDRGGNVIFKKPEAAA